MALAITPYAYSTGIGTSKSREKKALLICSTELDEVLDRLQAID